MAKKQALIVEDNREIGEIYSLTLRMLNYEVDHILDGKEALDHLETHRPDVIILDMNLPQVSGHYIFKQLRSNPEMDHILIIISTANNLLADALKDELGPRDTLLMKPVSPKKLKELIEAKSK